MNNANTNAVTLRIYNGTELVEQRTLEQSVIKIGKLESSHVHLADESVARMHAVVEVSGSDVRVIDLGSTAGTALNGSRVDKNAALRDGDQLTIGPYRLEVALRSAAASVPAAGPTRPSAPAPRAERPALGAIARQDAQHSAPVLAIDASAVERLDGSTVAEVTAVYGDTVLDVQHVGQTKSRRASAPVYLGLGGLLLLCGASLFAHDAVFEDWDAYSEAASDAAAAQRPAPPVPGWGTGGLGIALALCGLVPFGLGLIRLGDKGVLSYTIGEGHHATFKTPASGLPSPEAFPLVSAGPRGGNVLKFTERMSGSVSIGARTQTLEELVASNTLERDGSIFSIPLEPGVHCRIEHQGLKFLVGAVPPGRATASKSEADKPFWLYSAASLAVAGSLLTLAHLAMPAEDAMDLDDQLSENRFVGYVSQPDEKNVEEEAPVVATTESVHDAGGQGTRHAGVEGAMGNPAAEAKQAVYAMAGPKDAVKQMARNFDPDVEARTAGVLGMIQKDSGHFLASPFGGAFAVGNDDADLWGGMVGTELGEGYGSAGLGLLGTGRGGGGQGEGTVGYGKVGLMGKGGGGGTTHGYGRGSNTGFGPRGQPKPIVRSSKVSTRGAVDKDVIRRVVRAHINEVRHCYNQGLVRDPNLKGRVAVQFTIGPSGKVPLAVVAETSVKDRTVSNCVAQAVKRWSFPKPDQGGNVIVTYPFLLSPG